MRLQVTVTTHAQENSLEQLPDGTWKARVTAPPERGKANRALTELLAARFGVPKRDVMIATGRASRLKTVKIEVA